MEWSDDEGGQRSYTIPDRGFRERLAEQLTGAASSDRETDLGELVGFIFTILMGRAIYKVTS